MNRGKTRNLYFMLITICSGNIIMCAAQNTSESVISLRGHTDDIISLACDVKRNRVMTGSLDKTGRIWDAHTGKLLHTLNDDAPIYALAFNFDGTLACTGSYVFEIRVWDTQTGQLKHTITDPDDRDQKHAITALVCSPEENILVAGSWDAKIHMWNPETGQLLRTLSGAHSDGMTSLAYSPDNKYIVAGSADGTASIWDAKAGELLRTLQGAGDWLNKTIISSDSASIATSTYKTVFIWDLQTGAIVHELKHADRISSIAYTPDNKYILCRSENMIYVWDASGGSFAMFYRTEGSHERQVDFSSDGNFEYTICSDSCHRYDVHKFPIKLSPENSKDDY